MRAQAVILVLAAIAILIAAGLFLYAHFSDAPNPNTASPSADIAPPADATPEAKSPAGKPLPKAMQAATPGTKPNPPSTATSSGPAQEPSQATSAPVESENSEFAQDTHAAVKDTPKATDTLGKGTLRGQVLLDESPLPGAQVTLQSAVDNTTLSSAISDENGAFLFENVGVGDVTVAAVFSEANADPENPRQRSLNVPVIIEKGQITPVWIRATSGDATIHGTVTVEGTPATDFSVSGWLFTESGTEDIFFNTGPDGTFEHAGLPPARVKIQARVWGDRNSGDQRVLAREIDLAPGATEVVNFNFESGGVIFGAVTNLFPGGNNGLAIYAGHLPPNDPKQMTPEEFYHFHQTMMSNIYLYQNPQFRSESIPPGDYTISAYSIPGAAREAAAFREGRYDIQHITLVDGQELELNFNLQ